MGKNSASNSANSGTEKKLKLFGVELDPFQFHDTDQTLSVEADDESASSSSPSSTITEKLPNEKTPRGGEPHTPRRPAPEAKKFNCPCCFKVFANSQALGGHQNAHKNERMRKKKLQLQLQARNASSNLNSYTTPYFNNFCDKNSGFFLNFCGSKPAMFTNKEVCINFGSDRVGLDMNYDHEVSRWYDLRCSNYMQQNKHRFSLTQVDGSRRNSSLSSPESKRICTRKELDLQLGLSL